MSVNAVVGETNDSRLNDIRTAVRRGGNARSIVCRQHRSGGGRCCRCWNRHGRFRPQRRDRHQLANRTRAGARYTVGVLVQSNYGGKLRVDGRPYEAQGHDKDGSIVMVVATDAPLCSRNLQRLAERCFGGLARTGAALSNGSGDYALAFSTAEEVRRTPERRKAVAHYPVLSNDVVSPLFEAVIEASEEAILNSLAMATTTHGYNAATSRPSTIHAISLDALKRL